MTERKTLTLPKGRRSGARPVRPQGVTIPSRVDKIQVDRKKTATRQTAETAPPINKEIPSNSDSESALASALQQVEQAAQQADEAARQARILRRTTRTTEALEEMVQQAAQATRQAKAAEVHNRAARQAFRAVKGATAQMAEKPWRAAAQAQAEAAAQAFMAAAKAARKARREVKRRQLCQQLAEEFPAVFGPVAKPLKLGIDKDLLAWLNPEFGSVKAVKRTVRSAVAVHVSTLAYQQGLAAGGPRYDLHGQEVGEVTEQERLEAQQRVERRQAKAERRKKAADGDERATTGSSSASVAGV